jgi:hypothetical protein
MRKLFGAIEAGGTKFNCMVATDPNHITEEIRISTKIGRASCRERV